MKTAKKRTRQRKPPPVLRLLPDELLSLPLARLLPDAELAATLAERDLLTIADLLQTTAKGLDDAESEAVRQALGRALFDGLRQFATAAELDLPTLRAQLLGPLDDNERIWVGEVVGFDEPPPTRPELARRHGIAIGGLESRIDRLRERLNEVGGPITARLRTEVVRELAAFDGVLHPEHAAKGTLLHLLANAGPDPELGLRLAAFCLPGDVHLHRGVLYGVSPRRYRKLLRALPGLVPQHRLPLPLDVLAAELRTRELEVPRGLLQHVLRRELHVAIELDPDCGEIAAPDPLRPAARLVELLLEAGQPMLLTDLRFAYRERFRFAGEAMLRRHLQQSEHFVRIGPELWSLRRWHPQELHEVAPLVDRVARQLCADGGRKHVADLLGDVDERTTFLVLDRLAADPRVRLLGRGDACAASHRCSSILEQLLQNFRRAAGDVVLSLFLDNQPPQHRRLIGRLLHENRLFLQPTEDRIDALSNYPFNQERMQRLLQLVDQELQQRAGYAGAAALKTVVDRTDLGGDWLTSELLADVLRRNGPFEVLPGLLVARADLMLSASVVKQARQALRDADGPVTVAEMLLARPELSEFAGCLGELLEQDPLVMTPDGRWFTLA